MTFRSRDGFFPPRLWAVLSLLMIVGCHRTVVIHAHPVEAAMTLPDGRLVLTPTRITVPTGWFASYSVEVSAPGYRSFSMDLANAGIGGWAYFRAKSRYQPERIKTKNPAVVIRLVPKHPPVP